MLLEAPFRAARGDDEGSWVILTCGRGAIKKQRLLFKRRTENGNRDHSPLPFSAL
jgi:hypothetical protein